MTQPFVDLGAHRRVVDGGRFAGDADGPTIYNRMRLMALTPRGLNVPITRRVDGMDSQESTNPNVP